MNPSITLNKVTFDLHEVIDKTVALLNIIAVTKRIRISYEIDSSLSFCYSDPLLLNQLVFKCVENAIKHSAPESSVELKITALECSKILITVSDHGVGMLENENCPVLIEKLSEIMGGKTWVESTPGKGSIFSCTISINKEQLSEDCLSLPLKILVVDDSLDNRNIIHAYLKKFPFEIYTAENGAEALSMMKCNHYDLVLMDIQMPVMDGLTATKMFREWEKENHKTHLPIAALTAFALKEDHDKSLKAGCDLHITKPVKKVTILETIKELTSKTA